MSEPLELTELQLALMRVLWLHGEATVADVHVAIEKDRGLALTTVATIMTRLERQGLIARRPEGRHYVYRPLVSEEDVRRSMVSELAERLFAGDVTALVSHLLSASEIAPGDLEHVRRLLEAKQRGKGS